MPAIALVLVGCAGAPPLAPSLAQQTSGLDRYVDRWPVPDEPGITFFEGYSLGQGKGRERPTRVRQIDVVTPTGLERVSIPSILSYRNSIFRGGALVLASSAPELPTFRPVLPSGPRAFVERDADGVPHTWTIGPWSYIGARFRPDGTVERVTVEPYPEEIVDRSTPALHVRFLSHDAFPTGYVVVGDDPDPQSAVMWRFEGRRPDLVRDNGRATARRTTPLVWSCAVPPVRDPLAVDDEELPVRRILLDGVDRREDGGLAIVRAPIVRPLWLPAALTGEVQVHPSVGQDCVMVSPSVVYGDAEIDVRWRGARVVHVTVTGAALPGDLFARDGQLHAPWLEWRLPLLDLALALPPGPERDEALASVLAVEHPDLDRARGRLPDLGARRQLIDAAPLVPGAVSLFVQLRAGRWRPQRRSTAPRTRWSPCCRGTAAGVGHAS